MSLPAKPSRQAAIAEIMKCGKDPSYFMKKYCKIQHQLRGLIPFDTYDFQDKCVNDFQNHRFNIVLKSRQLGLSTVTAAYCVWYAIFKKDKNILVIATKLHTAINFIKKVKTMLDGLPPWLLLTKFEPTKQSIRFSNGSTITAVPTSPDAGRSEALALLVVDEAAFIRDFDDIWTSLYPTLSTGGSAIILSTPNGVGGQYYRLWTEAESGANDFNPIRLPWTVHPEHDQAWFDKETRNLPKRKVAQEFLCVAEGTRIVTKDGFKEVENLAIGDEVLTHKGNFKKVLRTHSRLVDPNEKLYKVVSPGNRKNHVLITGNHPALAYRFWANQKSSFDSIPENLPPEWLQIEIIASKKKTTDRILTCLFPSLNTSLLSGELTRIDLTSVHESVDISEETCRYKKQWGETKRFVDVDYDLGKMVGLYLAEGCKSHCGGLDLGFHINEWETQREWVEKYLNRFGCRTLSGRNGDTNGCRIWTYNKYFGKLVRMFVKGDLAHNKHLDMNLLMKTNQEFLKGLLEGHYLGDGNHTHTKKFSIFSTSDKLIYQLRTLYSIFNLHPRIGRSDLNKKNSKHHDMWYLEFYANGLSYSELLASGQQRLSGTRLIKHAEYFVGNINIEDVSNMINTDGGVTVYDIKVEDDASFVAESIVLHNCDFISSGDTYLQPTEFDKLREMLKAPLRKEGPQNNIWIWKDPEAGKKYVISSDVARGDSSDYSTFHVIDHESCEVVAEFMGKIPPDKLGDLLFAWGKKYNDALICPEQNTFGYFTCVKLRDAGYPKLYYQNHQGDVFEYRSTNPDAIPGFSTQQKTRTQILAKLEEVIRNGKLKIHSQRVFDQLQAFVWNGSKAQAAKDAHDDLIMGLAIGVWLVSGDSAYNEQGVAMAYAMLKATGISNRRIDELPGGINDVKPVPNPHIQGYTPDSVHKPRNPESVRHTSVTDFSWLFK